MDGMWSDSWSYPPSNLFTTPAAVRQQQPETVTPQQIFPSIGRDTYLPAAYELAQESGVNGSETLPCFARIEFADGTFQVTTYTVVIGRDRAALKKASVHQKRAELARQMQLSGRAPGSDSRKMAQSYVSEKGGICGPESHSGDDAEGRREKPKSADDGEAMDVDMNEEELQSDRRYVSHTPGAAIVDVDALRPSPETSCFLGIHSPGPQTAKKSKAISRKHMKIYYDKYEGVFKSQGLHNNGYFLNDTLRRTEPVVLKSGDWLQIKDIRFQFLITGVAVGCTGGEDLSKAKDSMRSGGKSMSFDFVQNPDAQTRDTSEELSSPDAKMVGDVEEQMQQKVEEAEQKPTKTSPKLKSSPKQRASPKSSPKAKKASPTRSPSSAQAAPVQPKPNGEARQSLPQAQPTSMEGIEIPEGFLSKKRGPGRPPKNGIMSKRQQRELKKLQEQQEKERAAELPPPEEPIKRKVGRPRKHALPEGAELPAEKRQAMEGLPDVLEGGEEKKPKEKKTKPTRPKSPPLQLNREDYTEEQLAKPSKNYCQMIDEKLTPAGREGLTLKQIYKRIATEWPYFHFGTETKGWESSVRHNLIGNDAFAKDEERGVWYRRSDVDIDAGKKTQKRDRSPTMHQSAQHLNQQRQYYAAGQHMPQPQNGYLPQYHQGYPVANQQMQQPGQPNRPVQYGQPIQAPLATGQQSTPQQPGFVPAQATGQAGPAAPQTAAYGQPHQQQPAAQYRPANGGNVPAQPAQQTASRPAVSPPQPDSQASNAADPNIKPHIEPHLVALVNRTRKQLHQGLSDAKCPNPDEILWSAIDRALGIKKENSSGNNKQMEAIAAKGINSLIEGAISKYRPNNPDGTPPYKTLLDPEISRHLVNFRESVIGALKNKFTEDEAHEMTNHAIVTALGFTDRPPFAKDAANKFSKVLQGNVKNLLNKLPTRVQMKEHEALLRGGTPGSRSAATPTPVRAAASPVAGAAVNMVPVPPRQGSAAMSPPAPDVAMKSAPPQAAAPASGATQSQPPGQTAMSPPVQGPPPPVQQPIAAPTVQRAPTTEQRPAVPIPHQAQAQGQAQGPTQPQSSAQPQPLLPTATAPAAQQAQSQPQVQAQTQATQPQAPVTTSAPAAQQAQPQGQTPATSQASAPKPPIGANPGQPQAQAQQLAQNQGATQAQEPSKAQTPTPPQPQGPSASQSQPQAQTEQPKAPVPASAAAPSDQA